MDGYDGLGTLCDAVFDLLDIDIVGSCIDIHEDRRCAAVDNRFGGSDETVGGKDYFSAFADLESLQGQDESIRSVADSDSVTDFAEFRERPLKVFNRGAANKSGVIERFFPNPAEIFAQEMMFGLEFDERDLHELQPLVQALWYWKRPFV